MGSVDEAKRVARKLGGYKRRFLREPGDVNILVLVTFVWRADDGHARAARLEHHNVADLELVHGSLPGRYLQRWPIGNGPMMPKPWST